MKKLLKEFIERGWIEPLDSEWPNPAFIVPKKEKGEWRLVVDYRGLNEQTKHDSYSLPLIDSILQKQAQKRIFTVLVKVLPWVVDGAGGLGAGKTSGAGTRGVDLNAAIGGRTGDSDTNRGESSNNRSKIHADCYPAENPSL